MEYTTIEEVLLAVAENSEELIEKTDSKEEKAFYLGMLNLARAITNPEKPGVIKLCVNYDRVKAIYTKTKAPKNQITLEELFPELFAALDKRIEEKLKKKKPNKTEE